MSSPWDVWALFLLIFVFYFLKWEPKAVLFKLHLSLIIALGILKLGVGLLTPHHGLIAKYWANTTHWEGEWEKSTEFNDLRYTRIDPQIAFYNVGYSLTKTPFPIWFLNDHKRFNWYLPSQPNRNTFKFSAQWEGFLYVPKDAKVQFFIQALGGGTLWVDGTRLLDFEILSSVTEETASIYLEKGIHEIVVTYFHPEVFQKQLALLWQSPHFKKKVISSRYLYPQRTSENEILWRPTLERIGNLLFVFHGILLIFLISSSLTLRSLTVRSLTSFFSNTFWKGERQQLFWVFIIFVAYGFFHLLLKRAPNPQFNVLKGGDDELMYITHARNIFFNGLLDPTIGAFYFVPGYHYILAALHKLFGEGLFMILWLQRIFFSLGCIFLYFIAKDLFSRNIALLSILAIFFYPWTNRFSRRFFAEIFAFVFSSASLWCLIKLFQNKKGYGWTLCGGLLLGLSILMRPNFALFPLFIVIIFFCLFYFHKEFLFHTVIFCVGIIFVICPITIRNYLVTNKVVILSTNASINLVQGNPIPPHINIDTQHVMKSHFYNRFNLDFETRRVIEFARQKPRTFLKVNMKKILYLMGIRLSQDKAFVWEIFIVSILFLGVLLGYWKEFLDPRHFLILGFIFIQLGTLVIFTPWVHGHRLQTPIMPYMIIYVITFFYRSLLFLKQRTLGSLS